MSTAIKRIVINELDLTTAAQVEESLDVVYIPGLFGAKYICFDTAKTPATTGTASYADVGDVFINMASQTAFTCIKKEIANLSNSETNDSTYNFAWDSIDFIAPFFTQYDSDKNIDVSATKTIVAAMTTFSMQDPERCDTIAELSKFGQFYFTADGVGNSIDFASYVLSAGLPVVYHCGAKFSQSEENVYIMSATASDMYTELNASTFANSCFNAIVDTSEIDVKYITSGIYSAGQNTEGAFTYPYMLGNMITAASTRGDAFALIDSGMGQSVAAGKNTLYSILEAKNPNGVSEGTYASAFAPWAYYNLGVEVLMPPSFGYLLAFADSIKTNGCNMAIAGTTRGLVPKLVSLSVPAGEKLSNAVADSWQSLDSVVNVNAITNIRNYGLCIWGNRTLHNNKETQGLVDSSFTNIRNMLCDIKKTVKNVAMRLLFEQNNDVLWSNFLFGITPTLERLKSTAGISTYKIVKVACDDKTKLKAKIQLVTIKALEQIEVSIVMTDSDVDVE